MSSQVTRIDQSFPFLIKAARRISHDIAACHANDVDSKGRFPIETISALREAGILSAGVPHEFGGAGCTMTELTKLCSTLSQSCGSSGMILAMHYIQLGCITRHGLSSVFFQNYMRELVQHQYLLSSMTSEVGTFGDTRSSICAIESQNGRFVLNKDATTGSYCSHADAILVTCRRHKETAASDQVLVLVTRNDCQLTQTSSWDTLGMRGTCSPGFRLESSGSDQQIIPGSYADSSAQTMVPYSHILWSSLWWGIASGALAKAANFVRGQARQNPGIVPPTAMRLAEASMQLQSMRQNWQSTAQDFDALSMDPTGHDQLLGIEWALRLNNLKIMCSEAAPIIVHRALQIVGILGYKNDSPFSLSRYYRDSLSASVMISNERIVAKNASMLLVFKDTA